jgi:hypothetical protein
MSEQQQEQKPPLVSDQELQELEALMDRVNIELLSGAPCKIHEMNKQKLHEFMAHQEKLYRECVKLHLSRSLKQYKVGLDFAEYAKQAKNKKEKKPIEGKTPEAKKANKKTKDTNFLGSLNLDFSNIEAMKADWCTEHKKWKKECGCQVNAT